jgi:NDP-sugar pyrophosphorylase family protein
MKVIIPMAGLGDRFILKGYKDPKPLIKVNNKRIIEYILEMFPNEDDYIFICNGEHIDNTNMSDILKSLKPNCKIVTIDKHKKGPVFTVKSIFNLINDDDEIIISYCDNPYIWNIKDFKTYIKENNLDGCILTHTGFHPHTLSNTKMAFIKENNGIVNEIKEKECYTDNPMDEHASTGVYYFKKGKFVKNYFNKLIDLDLNYNGEYYVTLVYNLLIKDNLKVGYYDTDFVTVFGTPEEVENFEAWNTIIGGSQVKNETDLINCYNYWKNYKKNNQS